MILVEKNVNNFIKRWSFLLFCDTLYMEMMHMEIKTGYLYHIRDEYFDVVDDDSLMQSHEKGKKRPTYFTIKKRVKSSGLLE